MNMRQLLTLILTGATLLAGCSVHKLDIRQGNALDPKALARIQPGITRQQVQYLLGNPLIEDPFHAQRWDYVYYLKPGKGAQELKRVTIFFDGDQVVRVESVPAAADQG